MALSADMKVYPSGLAVATAWPPMLVEAPGRLSTMICWPSVWRMASATVRASTSVPPPAGYGTTQRRGWSGQAACWARAQGAAVVAPAAARADKRVLRCMGLPPNGTIKLIAASAHPISARACFSCISDCTCARRLKPARAKASATVELALPGHEWHPPEGEDAEGGSGGCDALVNGAKDARAVLALDFDADGVAELHEFGAGLAVLDGLDAALFGDAAVALGPFGAAVGVGHALVAHGAAADDGARAQVARLGHVGDQLAEVEGHLGARVAHADLAAVPGGLHGEVHAAMVPGVAQLVQCDGHGAEGGGGLALEETETLGQLGRDQVAQAHVVGNHHQADAVQRLVGGGAHLHVAGDDGDLGLEVDAHGFAGHHDVVARADEVVAAALVHQGVGVEAFGYFGVARFSHQFNVVDVGRAIRPLVGAGQRGHALLGVKREGVARAAAVELVVQVLQLGRDEAPVVQRLLQLAGNAGRIMGCAQVAGDDNQLAVALAVFVGSEFHGGRTFVSRG